MTVKVNAFETGLFAFCANNNVKARRWVGVARAQVFEVCAPENLLVYVKDSALTIGWWGIAFTVYQRLAGSSQDWRLALLVREGEEGYLLSGTQIKGMVSALSTNATEYILHEADATAGWHFTTFEALYKRLLTQAYAVSGSN
jgi:hypothetical protein